MARATICIAMCVLFWNAHTIRDDADAHEKNPEGVVSESVKAEFTAANTALSTALSAYEAKARVGDPELTLAMYNNLLESVEEGGRVINEYNPDFLELKKVFEDTKDQHTQTETELQASAPGLEAAHAALAKHGKLQVDSQIKLQSILRVMQEELAAVTPTLTGVDQKASFNDTDLTAAIANVEGNVQEIIAKARGEQSKIAGQLKISSTTASGLQNTVEEAAASAQSLRELTAKLKTLNTNDGQFFDDAVDITTNIGQAAFILGETKKCPKGTYSNDDNGITGCTPCESIKAQIVKDYLGDLSDNSRLVDFFGGRKSLDDLYAAFTYFSEEGSYKYTSARKVCVPKMCCCKDAACKWVHAKFLVAKKFKCPKDGVETNGACN